LLIEPIFWLKEFSESWVNVISDEVVYYEQITESESGGIISLTRNRRTYIESYLRRNLWLEILFEVRRNGQSEFYCALIEAFEPVNIEIFTRTRQPCGNRDSGCPRQDNSMLVNNISDMKYPKRVHPLLPIRSIIRLNRLDIRPDVLTEAFKSIDEFVIPIDKDWKANGSILPNSENPSDIVQSRTQSMNDFANQKPPRDRILFDKIRADDIASILRVFINRDSVRLTCDEAFNFSIEDVKVFLRPIDTSEGVSHLLYILYPER